MRSSEKHPLQFFSYAYYLPHTSDLLLIQKSIIFGQVTYPAIDIAIHASFLMPVILNPFCGLLWICRFFLSYVPSKSLEINYIAHTHMSVREDPGFSSICQQVLQ